MRKMVAHIPTSLSYGVAARCKTKYLYFDYLLAQLLSEQAHQIKRKY